MLQHSIIKKQNNMDLGGIKMSAKEMFEKAFKIMESYIGNCLEVDVRESYELLKSDYAKQIIRNFEKENILNEIKEYCNNPLNWKYTDHYLEKEDILEIIERIENENK